MRDEMRDLIRSWLVERGHDRRGLNTEKDVMHALWLEMQDANEDIRFLLRHVAQLEHESGLRLEDDDVVRRERIYEKVLG